MTTGSCHSGLADQTLKRSLLLRQSRTALILRIFSSFLLQDLLLHPSDPHHWFTGMPLLHIRAHVLEVMNLIKTLSMDSCVRRRSCDGSTTSLIAQSIVHFHMSRHSLRPDLSHPLECMPCFQSSAMGFRRWYALNEIIISEAKANITEDFHQLCLRINDSSLPLDPTFFDVSLLPVHNERCCYKGE
ncbi:hypothetical protein T12_6806 [Trichinella patagoniensis]|uniref:Uncharacterized protein n=1 Tax=Trichinella patagoniensis TaxID=990121 RepID=A0A0V1A0I1_9BILA|nr:hypothetical protein T12_6806 [Trichinella patagoniensis]